MFFSLTGQVGLQFDDLDGGLWSKAINKCAFYTLLQETGGFL